MDEFWIEDNLYDQFKSFQRCKALMVVLFFFFNRKKISRERKILIKIKVVKLFPRHYRWKSKIKNNYIEKHECMFYYWYSMA